MSQTIYLMSRMQRGLLCWSKKDMLSGPCQLGYTSWTIVTTDASMQGWGQTSHCSQTLVQARWSFPTIGIVSNVLEIWTAFLALTAMAPQIKGKSVLLRMDNHAAVSYIQRQGEHTAKPY